MGRIRKTRKRKVCFKSRTFVGFAAIVIEWLTTGSTTCFSQNIRERSYILILNWSMWYNTLQRGMYASLMAIIIFFVVHNYMLMGFYIFKVYTLHIVMCWRNVPCKLLRTGHTLRFREIYNLLFNIVPLKRLLSLFFMFLYSFIS